MRQLTVAFVGLCGVVLLPWAAPAQTTVPATADTWISYKPSTGGQNVNYGTSTLMYVKDGTLKDGSVTQAYRALLNGDTYVQYGTPNTNYGTATSIAVKNVAGTSWYDRRGLLRFDMNGTADGAYVTDASVTLWCTRGTEAGDAVTMNLSGLPEGWWPSSVTWNTQPATITGVLASHTYSNANDTVGSYAPYTYRSSALLDFVRQQQTGNGGNAWASFQMAISPEVDKMIGCVSYETYPSYYHEYPSLDYTLDLGRTAYGAVNCSGPDQNRERAYGLVRFDLRPYNIQGMDISKATLKVYARSYYADEVAAQLLVYGNDSTGWGETSATWNSTQPHLYTHLVAGPVAVPYSTAKSWYSFDVTDFVQKRQYDSRDNPGGWVAHEFVLETESCWSNQLVFVATKEDGHPAQLVIETNTQAPAGPAGAIVNADSSRQPTSPGQCAYTTGWWNAPKGAIVQNRNPSGQLAPIIDNINEYRTHTAFSAGPSLYVFQATASNATPPTGTSGTPTQCGLSSAALQAMQPGAEAVTQGAQYAYYFDGSANNYLKWQKGLEPLADYADIVRSEGTADWLMSLGSNHYWMPEQTSAYYNPNLMFPWPPVNSQFWKLYKPAYDPSYPDLDFPYSIANFWSIDGRQLGQAGWNDPVYGVQCSSFVPYAYARYQMDTLGQYSPSDFVDAQQYGQPLVWNAANAMWSWAYNECMGTDLNLSFLQNVGVYIFGSCGGSKGSICGGIANQIINCFYNAPYGCSDLSSTWSTGVNSGDWASGLNPNNGWGGVYAYSITPDKIGGWSGWPWADYAGPWAKHAAYNVQWNQPGTSFGCWY